MCVTTKDSSGHKFCSNFIPKPEYDRAIKAHSHGFQFKILFSLRFQLANSNSICSTSGNMYAISESLTLLPGDKSGA